MDRGIRDYLNIVKRWWWLLVISAIIPMVITYYFTSKQPDVYQAKVTIVVGGSVFQDPNPDSQEIALSNTLAAAYAELATRRTVLERVIQRLGLKTTPENLADQVGVNVRSGAQLLEIRVLDADPETSALIANALADELIRRSPISEESLLEQQRFIEIQLEDLEAKIAEVDAQIAEWTASLTKLTSASEIQDTQARIDALEQVKSRYQATYADLLSVSRTESANELSLFEPAVVPSSPVPRQTVLMVVVSGGAGVGLALGAVLLMEYLDTSVRWSKDGVQSIADLPVLGAIPQESKRDGLLFGNPLSPIADAVRSLRVNIFLTHPQHPYTALLLTSPGISEGKSFITANLAIALAAVGNRVIVVDADMRRPALHEFFNQMNVIGLSEILSRSDGEEFEPSVPLQKTDFENLRLLSAGRPPADPTALLTSSRLPSLLACLKDQADIVLIDSPPVLGIPDTRLVATLAEGVILVARAGVTRCELVQRAKEELLANDVSLLGIVVNRVKLKNDYYYYSSYTRGTKHRGAKSRGQNGTRGWLSPRDVAEILGISKSMTREWCKNGRLPATRKGLWWRVDRDRFAQMLEDTWDVKLEPHRASERAKRL